MDQYSYAAMQRRENCDYRHVAARRRARRSRRFDRSFLRVGWSAGQRVIFVCTDSQKRCISQRWSNR